MQVKKCPKCLESRSSSQFNKDSTKSNGLSSYCKDCNRANYYEKHRTLRRRVSRLSNEEEKWEYIMGYNEGYQVSSIGRIYSIKQDKILKQVTTLGGYKWVRLSAEGVKKCLLVHRLVAEAFLPNPDKKSQVNHKQGIKGDNRVSELEWTTASENRLHSIYTLGSKKKRTIDEETISKIKFIYKTEAITQQEIADRFRLDQTTVSLILRDKLYKLQSIQ